mmetsp:Transcript_23527/g.34202  ORF Transcript_23527/g.34202 Transcript_23527/m.34202 type:complete len:95 (-) Transcript_23527:112-396(-)
MNAVQKSPGPPSLTTSRYIKEEPSALSSSSSSSVEAPLDFYAEIPSYELSLDEFEEFALARLKVRLHLLFFVTRSFIHILTVYVCVYSKKSGTP